MKKTSHLTDCLKYEAHRYSDAGWCPNNPELPLIVYREVDATSPGELAGWLEETFDKNGWQPAWRYTIYDFAHFHSNTHEVIGAYRGHALIRFGDSTGESIEIAAGDVVLIPAGVSHQRIDATQDFIAVGAYPQGREPDQIRKSNSAAHFAAAIKSVPIPSDPLDGADGPLQAEWAKKGRK